MLEGKDHVLERARRMEIRIHRMNQAGILVSEALLTLRSLQLVNIVGCSVSQYCTKF